MSYIITIKVPADVDVFRKAMDERQDDFVKVVENAKGMGALHHRFGVGDGYVLAVDEWQSPQDFDKFFADPDMQAFVHAIGASGPPEITVAEAMSTVDQF